MKAHALQPTSESGPAKKHKAESHSVSISPWSFQPVSAIGCGIIQRQSACACGGGCPACQAKSSGLKISQPDDPAEIEADQIADRVMRMSVDDAKPKSNFSHTANAINCKCDACEYEKEEVDESTVMRKEAFASAAPTPPPDDTPPSIKNVINSGGQPLDLQTRNFFEPRFGTDLSHVRIHTNSAANKSARAINARAYTLGNNIVFGSGEFRHDYESGKHLLAHELAHVVQQLERSADRTASGDTYQGNHSMVIQRAVRRTGAGISITGLEFIPVGIGCLIESLLHRDRFSNDVGQRISYDHETESWNRNEGRTEDDWLQAIYDAWGHCYIAACMTRRVPEVETWAAGTLYELLHEAFAQVPPFSFVVGHNSLSQDYYNQAVGRDIGVNHPDGDLYEICFDAMMHGRLDLTLAGVVPRGRPLVPGS